MRTHALPPLLAAAVLGLAGTAFAQPEQQGRDFAAANDRALARDPKGAIALYESLVTAGVRSEDLFFNLGNAHVQAGDLVAAVVAYERARRIAPGDADVEANLALVRSRLAPEGWLSLEPADPIDRLEPLVAGLPADAFALTAAIANLLLFGLLAARRRLRTGARRRGTAFGLGLSLAVLLASGAVVWVQGAVARDARAVVRRGGDLRAGPKDGFARTDDVFAGELVRVTGEDGEWREVKRRSGTAGWIRAADLERI